MGEAIVAAPCKAGPVSHCQAGAHAGVAGGLLVLPPRGAPYVPGDAVLSCQSPVLHL